MSKKARDTKRLRRKMMSVWHEKEFQEDLQQTFVNLLTYDCTGVVTDKDGKTRVATTEEIEDAIRNGEIIREDNVPFKALYMKFAAPELLKEELERLNEKIYKIALVPKNVFEKGDLPNK